MQHITKLQPWLEAKSRRVVIIPHQRPDADALGSGLGLYHWLIQNDHTVNLVSPTEFPAFLNWMPGSQEIVIFPKDEKRGKRLISEADLIVCVDFSGLKRIEPLDEWITKNSGAKTVVIDHHLGKEDFADFELWDVKAAATAELIYDMMHLFGQSDQLNPQIAALLYAGIMTDTGSFKHSNTTPKVHRLVADLMERGLDINRIHRNIFDSNTENRTRFLGYALSQRLEVRRDFHVAFFPISQHDLEKYNSQNGDTEGLVNYALGLEGICLAAAFIERNGEIRISLRSVGDFSVSEMASSHFNGGGHKNASGGRFRDKTLTQAVKHFEDLLPQYKSALQQTAAAETASF